MLKDITERLEERAISYDQSGLSAHHTADLLREAKFEIEALRANIRSAFLTANIKTETI